jgi:hypothetical protein
MTTRKDAKPVEQELEELFVPETDTRESASQQLAGRIVHDERGNALWKWRGDTSSTDSTSGILKHLDPLDLKVEGQDAGPAAPNSNRARGPDAGGGYDPYNKVEPRSKPVMSGKGGQGKR